MRRRPSRAPFRTRPLVALVVLTAWLATLLVSTATSSSATLPAQDNPTISGPAIGSTTTPSFTISGPVGADLECAALLGSASPSSWTPCVAPTYAPTLGDGDGSYGVWVRSGRILAEPTTSPSPTTTDVADPNNPDTSTVVMSPSPTDTPVPSTYPSPDYSVEVSTTYVLQTGGGTVAQVSGPADGAHGAGNVHWSFSASGFGVTCALTGPGGYSQTDVCGSADPAFPSATLPADGTYTLVATADDGLGTHHLNLTYVVDTAAPTITITDTTATGTGQTVKWAVSISDALSQAGSTVSCTLAPVPAASTDCAQFASYPLPSEGTWTLTVTGKDGAGVAAAPQTVSHVYDVAPGPATLTGPTTPGNATTVSWTVVAPADATGVSCVVTGPTGFSRGALCNPGTTTFSTDLNRAAVGQPASYVDGTYTLTVAVTDNGGTGPNATAAYVLDHTAPVVVITPDHDNWSTPAAGWSVGVTGGGTPTCTVTNSAGSTVGSGSDCTRFTMTLPAEDTYTFTATSVDGVGNVTTATDTWIYRSAPSVAVTTPQPTGNSSSVGFHVTGTNGATFTCTSTSTVDPNPACINGSTPVITVGPGQGPYTFTAVVTDPQTGFTGSASATYVYDSVAPDAFTVTGTSGDQPSRSVSWTWTPPELGLTQSCRLLLAGANYGTPSGCTSPYTTAVPSDGAWQLQVTLTDAAGNSTTATGPVDRVDTAVPLAPTVTTPKTLSNDTAPVWTISGESATVFTCSWTSTVGGLPATGPCTSGYAPTLPATNGVYTLHVTQTDAAGNVSPEKTVAYTLDVTKPTVTFGPAPVTPSTDTTPTWTTTVSETTVKTECRLERTGDPVPVHDWRTTGCGRTVTETLPADGTYVLLVRDTDAAGNVDPNGTSSDPYALDTTGPGTPTIDGPSGWNANKNVTWTINPPAGEVPAAYRCRLVKDGNPGSWSDCSGMTYSTTLNSQATYRLDVESLDALGNASNPTTSSADYMYDPNPPSPATFTGTAGTGSTPSRTWTWTAGEPQLTATCQLYSTDGTRTAVGTSSVCTSPTTVPLASPTTGTTYVLEVTLTDRAGNFTRADGPSYLLDTVAPDAPSVDGPTGTNSTRAATYTFVPAEPGTTASCQLMQRPTNSTTWLSVQTAAPCLSPWSVTLPNVDGDYAVRVVTTDAAGNPSLYGESPTYTLDVTGPVAPVFTSGPTNTANNKSVTWTWSYEPLSTGTCTLLHGTTALVAGVACDNGSYSTTLNDGDGDYTLTVRLTDQYHNLGGTTTSAVYTLDATPPGAPIVSGPSTTSNVTTVNYAITSVIEAGATAECRLERGATVVSDWASCALPTTRVLSGDGAYVFKVRLTDQYGNLGLPGSSPAYVLDTTAPSAPVVNAPSSPSHNAGPVFGFTIDADTTASCTLSRGSTVVAAAPSCAGSFTGSLSGLPDGDYVLTVTAKDAAGNTTSGSSAAYTYDTTAPPAPTVSGPAGPSQTRNPAFSWTAEPGARAECATQPEDGALSTWSPCSQPYAPTLSTDGTWTLSVRLTDSADNVSAVGTSGPYKLDTTAPSPPSVTAPASPGRDLAPSWSADVEAGSRTDCRLSGPGQTQTEFAPCSLPMSTPISTDGTYVLEVRATDVAGNVSPAGAGTYVLDTTPPAAPVVSQPSGPGRSRTPQLSYTAEPGTTGSCRVTRGSTVVVETAPCSSPVQLNLTDLPDGSYTLTVRAVDLAGNTGPASTGTYVLDTTAPAAPILTLIAGSPSSDRAPSYGFSVEPGSVATCRVTYSGVAVRDSGCTSPLNVDLSGSPDGDYGIAITTRDAAGNASAAATASYALDGSAPAAPRVVGPATPGMDPTPSWKVTSTAPAQCRLIRGTTVVKDWVACGGATPYQASLYGQPDGIYLLEARVVGTTAATTSRYRFDTTGPTAGAVVITGPPSPSTVRKPVWSIATTELGALAECQVSVFGSVLRDWTSCDISQEGTLFSYDLTGLGDGTYTLSVRLTDSAGNPGATATSAYELDTSAPAAIGVVGPTSPSNTTKPTWTLASTSGARLECRVTSGQTVIKAFTSCSGTYQVSLDGLPDGTYTLTVHALSQAGTPGPDTTSSYVLDQTPPDPPTALTSVLGKTSKSRLPAFTFVLPSGVTKAVCKVSFGGSVYREGSCTSPYTMDLTTADDGSYTLRVFSVDAAGNQSTAPATGVYTLRTVPPPAPEFTLEPSGPSSTSDLHWAFSTVYGVTTECRMLYQDVPLEGGKWEPCSSPYGYLLFLKPDGRYTLQVRAVDSAGNASTPAPSTYDFDRTAPALAVFDATPKSPDNETRPTWSVSAPPAAATTTPALLRTAALTAAVTAGGAECRFGFSDRVGGLPWTGCSGTYTGITNGDGRYTLELRAADVGAAAPVNRSYYQLDTKRPTPLSFTNPPPLAGKAPDIAWTWDDDPQYLVDCRLTRNGVLLSSDTDCVSPFTTNVEKQGQATYTLTVVRTDLAGNLSDQASSSYRYDTTPPPTPAFATRPAARGTSGTATWTFPLTGDAVGAVCVVTHDGSVEEKPCSGSYTLSNLSTPGTWQLSVYFVDAAGNKGQPVVGSYTLTTYVAPRDHSGGSGSDGTPSTPTTSAGGGGDFSVTPPVGHDPFLGSLVSGPTRPGPIARIKDAIKNGTKGLPHVDFSPIQSGKGVNEAIKGVIGSTITKPQLPLALFVILVLFLLVQNRIDRRDPKLAQAPVEAEPELEFGPRVRFVTAGGATA